MRTGKTNPKADVALAVGVIVLAIVFYVDAMSLPPAHWEPLGSAAVPQGLCVIMAGLALIVLTRAVRAMRIQAAQSIAKPTDEEFERRPWTAAGMFALCILYVAAMDFKVLGFVEATIAFMVALGLLFTRAQRRHVPWIVGFAFIIALGNYLIFTQFLYVDLPVVEWF